MSTTRITLKEAKKRLTPAMLKRLRVKDSEIDYAEIPELDENFWTKAKPRRGRPKKEVCKDMVNLRLDHFSVLALRHSGKGWQTRVGEYINQGIKNGVLLPKF
ncbi:MAG: BrnA antitoxin family protein [Candidatus Margulisbacteria bacterium]|jgi:uncharacterized protein (DUF4415 family)|nr:BrnA antitoxin family protein [Candidatus Margulisiibacteriota bacterium]